MLTIRAPQMKVFQLSALRRFEDAVLPHVARYFPNHHAILGRDRVRRVIRLGMERAVEHGFVTQSDVCRYLNLMLMFGSSFDRDPQLSWASSALRDMPKEMPAQRIEALASAGVRFFERIAGPQNAQINRAMLRLHHDLPAIRARAVEGDLAAHVRGLFLASFPAKSKAVTDASLRELVEHATATAARYGIRGAEGIALVVLIMFIAGSGFDEDPQHEWAAAALRDDEGPAGETARLDRLCAAARAYLAQWLERRD